MKKTVSLILISLMMIGLLMVIQTGLPASAKPPADPTETMQTANQLYENGQFAQAAQAYEQLVDQGFADSALFYNLGNTYFKQGDFGRAILNYRRATRLAPRDPDIRANLNLARSQAVDQLDPANSEAFFSHLVRLTEAWFTLNEMAVITLGLWSVFALVLIAFNRSKSGGRLKEGLQYTLITITLLLMLAIFSLGSRVYLEKTRPEGVVVVDELNVTSGPGSQYVTEFVLHSGAEVSLIEQRGSWIRLTLPGGETQGWAPARTVELITGQVEIGDLK